MKQFFKSFLGSLVAMIVAGALLMIIFFAILFGSIGSMLSDFDTDGKEKVKENSILHIKLDNEIVDRGSDNPLDNIEFGKFFSEKKLGLNDILENIKKAKDDELIKGIYLDLLDIPAGYATVEEVRNALIDFKESGKFIICYGEIYTQKAYYLASVADEINLYPEGYLDFRGFSRTLPFMKGTLEKLEIETQIIRGRNNKYKSAVEPLMYDKMSDANREQTKKYVSSLWSTFLKGITETRGISSEMLNTIADSLLIQTPEDALEHKLVDKLIYKDELLEKLKEKLELKRKDELNFVKLGAYAKSTKHKKSKAAREKEKGKSKKQTESVAVIYAFGGIESGEGDDETIGSETISKAIRKAREDSTVKAIVLRVTSGGGSALASDVIWRETVLAKAEKPFIVSMGNVAASGGYYIACAADRIFASPNTITGSIGVFGVLPNMKKFYNNKLGITFDGVNTNTHSDMGNSTRALDEFEFRKIQESVEVIYDDFIGKVAKGRGMTKEKVDEIGQGRVWSGIDAKEIGLVDEFGGLEDAIAYAAEKAELPEGYKVKSYPESEDPFKFLLQFSSHVESRVIKNELGDLYQQYKHIKTVTEMKGIQARMLYPVDVQ